MKHEAPQTPLIIPIDDEHARMMMYARSREGRKKIATAQTEIDAGQGIIANHRYFKELKKRRAARQSA
jgi:hypothetical protein